jgi:1-acyl-sn-glycerol-3-phosphate acyltransferase
MEFDFQQQAARHLVTPEISRQVAAIPKPVGSFGYDAWGFNEESLKLALALARPIYEKYFRVTVTGLENIPPTGRLLIIPNHGGQLPIDAFMLGYALATNPHAPRAARPMVERFLATIPYVNSFLTSIGAALGDPLNCSNMLKAEEAVIVFPEGIRGSGKPYRNRYQLQRFGAGFMHLAINFATPIVPVGIIGCEESMPALANLKPMAKLLGIPYLPLLPIYFPLPARIHIRIGKPMRFTAQAATEDAVLNHVAEVRDAVAALVAAGLAQRKSLF